MEAILGAEQTINSLVNDILDHYENIRENLLTGKAMIVAYSRPIAMKVYKRTLELRPAWTEKIGVVMTSGNKDPEEWRQIIGNKSDGVINLFSDIKEEFSLFDPKFLEEVANMKEKNLAVELLKKLIAEQVSIYRRTNVVKSEKFSEIMQRSLNAYLNGMLTNEQVIEEMLKLAKQIAAAHKEGDQLGLTADELAFYDALTKPQAIKDFYENDELIAITKELAETLRNNKTIDWQKRESARAKMRMLIKKLLKKHKYPPEGMEDAVQTVMTQCELWTDNTDMEY